MLVESGGEKQRTVRVPVVVGVRRRMDEHHLLAERVEILRAVAMTAHVESVSVKFVSRVSTSGAVS
jgi:hypothetical protein